MATFLMAFIPCDITRSSSSLPLTVFYFGFDLLCNLGLQSLYIIPNLRTFSEIKGLNSQFQHRKFRTSHVDLKDERILMRLCVEAK